VWLERSGSRYEDDERARKRECLYVLGAKEHRELPGTRSVESDIGDSDKDGDDIGRQTGRADERLYIGDDDDRHSKERAQKYMCRDVHFHLVLRFLCGRRRQKNSRRDGKRCKGDYCEQCESRSTVAAAKQWKSQAGGDVCNVRVHE
jgi:hypothetical protein